MSKSRWSLSLLAALLLVAPAAFAQIGSPAGGGDTISWNISASGHSSVELRVSCAGDVQISKSFQGGKPVTLSVRDFPGRAVEDGACTWEMYTVPFIPPGVAKQLSSARASGNDKAASKILKDAGISSLYQSGGLYVSNGGFVSPSASESNASATSPSTQSKSISTTAATAPSRGFNPVPNDQVIPDDLIVQGSACVGLDCVNNESFGFDTIRLKENNTRIKFDDTSSSAGFPANDWQLTANDSASGGSSKFSIEDITGSKVPFTVTAGASTNSIFVDSTGRIGARTSTPVLDFHITTNNTPAIRLEQTNSGGFTAQTWDIAGNEANFFVRDVTGGSKLPFRIRPGAPTSSLDISADGDVGIGIASPAAGLHIVTATAAQTAMRIQSTSATGNSGMEFVDDAGAVQFFAGWLNASDQNRINSLNSHPLIMMVNSTERLRVSTTGIAITGDMSATGTKSFAMADPVDPKTAIYYAALEGPEAGTYYRGTAKTVKGEVVIELPRYFSRITENERMTVQLTPVGAPGQLYVASKSPEKLVIRVANGADDLEFDFLVQGIRKGYLDYQVERANNLPR